jgi:putative transposase
MEMGKIYFWTATINNWNRLLFEDRFKDIILQSLQYLSDKNKIDVFAFVIMPNHIHLLWRINEKNGKETAQGSFLKFTAHEFRRILMRENRPALLKYHVEALNKVHEFWQRDSLAVRLYSLKMAIQKLNYIHANPVSKGWRLAEDMFEYFYSSARFYEYNDRNFAFLKNLFDEF